MNNILQPIMVCTSVTTLDLRQISLTFQALYDSEHGIYEYTVSARVSYIDDHVRANAVKPNQVDEEEKLRIQIIIRRYLEDIT